MISIYSASDDLVELESSTLLFKSEEFYVAGGENLIAISDGTLLAFAYGYSGIWRVEVLHKGYTFKEIQASNGCDNYTDVVILDDESGAPIQWIVLGKELVM